MSTRHRVLVATTDMLTARMAGPAIRAWHIAATLAAEHDVELVTTAQCELAGDGFVARSVDDDDLRKLEQWCDVLVFQGFLLHRHPFLAASDKVIVVDAYDPFHLEQLEVSRHERARVRREYVQASTAVLSEQLLRGDLFLCASPKQRDFWLGHLAAVGRVNPVTYDEDETLESLITVVPFGLSATPPVHTRPALRGVVPGIGPDDAVVLWGGGIYNWFDPLTLIRAVDRLRHHRDDVRLFFMGLAHPNPEVPAMRMAGEARQLAADLGLVGTHVFFNEGWVPYHERANYLLEADVAVSTHLDHVETAFSFRTRVLDYLWAGLPTITTAGDALAALVEHEQLGITVPPEDVDALTAALRSLLDDRELAAQCRSNVAAIAPRYRWSTVLEPLVEFCRAPRRAPDLLDPHMVSLMNRNLGIVHGEQRGAWADLRLAFTYLREGGPGLVITKARQRLKKTRGTAP